VGGYFILFITASSGYSNISGISEPPVPSISKTSKIRPITMSNVKASSVKGALVQTYKHVKQCLHASHEHYHISNHLQN
jgi:hypothetical protein